MRQITCLIILFLFSCNQTHKTAVETNDEITKPDAVEKTAAEPSKNTTPEYSNQRFRKVTVEKVNANKFRIKGEGQIFEASFNWVIEDGHNEIKKGFQMTDAGAPEWGKFDFTVEAQKPQNGTLTLILFEISAKDGSRQFELPILLD